MKKEQSDYHSYLLRLWCTNSYEQTIWHFSLENPETGTRHTFSSLAECVEFLEEKLSQSLESAESKK
jgi:hypothetical protein